MPRPKIWVASTSMCTTPQTAVLRCARTASCFPTASSARIRGSGHTAIIENKRLGHALALIKAQQDNHFEAKVKNNSEKGAYQKRGRQIYGPDYVPKIPAKTAAAAEPVAKKA
jgi:hypothetical protein